MARRGSTLPSRTIVLTMAVLTALLLILVTEAAPATAEDDLSPRLGAAFADAGITWELTAYSPDLTNKVEGWTLWIGEQDVWAASLYVERHENAQLARETEDLFVSLSGSLTSTVSVNGVTGHGGTVAGVSPATPTQGSVEYAAAYAVWTRDSYFVSMQLVQSTDLDLLLQVARVVDDVLSGGAGATGTTVAPVETTVPPLEPGLSAGASPAVFSVLGESVTVYVTLAGTDVGGKLVSLSGHGVETSTVTDGGGGASFTVTHNDPALTEYRFAVTCEGMTKEVVIPVSTLDIHAEIEPNSGRPYTGVVADGRTTLVIEIAHGPDLEGTLRVTAPDLGSLGGQALAADNTIALSEGVTTIEYTPPAYLENGRLDEQVPLPENSTPTITSARAALTVYANEGRPWVARVPLEFIHTDSNGRETSITLDVLVSRPPVMLVHGFIGGRGTWAGLQTYLAGQRFDPVINEYYAGDEDIHDQARALGGDIAREITRYASLGLKLSRVDVVGHSMGGLIARDYTYGLPPHPTDVRKIIMVGTPNHGASFFDKSLGNTFALLLQRHSIASQQLYSGSAFLARLNEGEVAGRHLSADVQYGNIYGVRSDWVVTGTSAYLNGVTSHILFSTKHSPVMLGFSGVAITESDSVFGWVHEWLGTDIPRAPLRGTKVQVVAGEGPVYLSGLDAGGETHVDIASFPQEVQPWEHVGTGPDGRAKIRLSVAGMVWGTIDLAPDSLVALGNLTPDAITVRIRRGSARFSSLERDGGGHFEVQIGETDPGEWTTLYPDAKVIGMDTDFVAAARGDGAAEVLVLEGRVLFDDGTSLSDDDMLSLEGSQAGAVGVPPGFTSQLAERQWWTDGFYRLSFPETLAEWWTVFRSWFQ